MTNNADNRILALYGGTFDPIHRAHINTVKAMASEAGLEQVILLPNNVPPHRPQPKADAKQRLMMAQLAVSGDPLFLVDDRELRRDALSYTVETLRQYRAEIGSRRPLALSLVRIPCSRLIRHEWDKILTLCHILVCKRRDIHSIFRPNGWLTGLCSIWSLRRKACTNDRAVIFSRLIPSVSDFCHQYPRTAENGEDCSDQLAPAVQDYILAQRLYR